MRSRFLAAALVAGFLPVPATPMDPQAGGEEVALVQGEVQGVFRSVVALPGGGFAAAGETVDVLAGGNSFDFRPQDGLVARYSHRAALEWLRVLDVGHYDTLAAVATDASGDLFLVGHGIPDEGGCEGATGWAFRWAGDGRDVWTTNLTAATGLPLCLTSALRQGDEVVVAALRATPPGPSFHFWPVLLRLGAADGVVRGWHEFRDLDLVGWLDLAPAPRRGEWFVAGYDGAGGAKPCAGRVRFDAVVWLACDDGASGATGMAWSVVPAGQGSAVAGWRAQGVGVTADVARRDARGDLAWVASHDPDAGTPGYYGYAAAVDGAGNVYVSGANASADLTFDAAVPPLHRAYHAGVAVVGALTVKVAPDGTRVWARERAEPPLHQFAWGNAVDEAGRLVVVGYQYDKVQLTAHPLVLRYADL